MAIFKSKKKSIRSLSQSELFERITDCCGPNGGDRPPFTLVIGSGFSFPIIPPTSLIVRSDLPRWMSCRQQDPVKASQLYQQWDFQKEWKDWDIADQQFASEFWKSVHASATIRNLEPCDQFKLDEHDLPRAADAAAAYRYVLSPFCTPGLYTPDLARRYFVDLVKRVKNQLNPAHLYLASIIAKYPKLIRTIFTTNLDPLLQRALQLVNASYYVSDRPDVLQHPDDDDPSETLHIVHAHGSIHRYLLLNSPDEIGSYAARNRSLLEQYFRKHSVLIVGYSGWDDAITRAMDGVDQFAHAIYWCDRGKDLESSGLSQKAKKLLARHANSFFVSIENADKLMIALHQHLTTDLLPELFDKPIESMLSQLDFCDLNGFTISQPRKSHATTEKEINLKDAVEMINLGEQVTRIKQRLNDALSYLSTNSNPDQQLAAQLRKKLDDTRESYYRNDWNTALPILDDVLQHADKLDVAERATAYGRRGHLYAKRKQDGDYERAMTDYCKVIDMPNVPNELLAKTLFNRAVLYDAGNGANEIADYDKIIEMQDISADIRSKALIMRGLAFSKKDRDEYKQREIDDYTAVINMKSAPIEQVINALLLRGLTYDIGNESEEQKSIDDFSKVLLTSEASEESKIEAYINRGTVLMHTDSEANRDKAMADFACVLSMPIATDNNKAEALIKRARILSDKKTVDDRLRAITECNRILDLKEVRQDIKDDAIKLIKKLKDQA